MATKTGIKGKGQYCKRPRLIDDAQRNEIVMKNLGLATSIAYKYADRRSIGAVATAERDIDDAKQEAILAMLTRVESFDENDNVTIGNHVHQTVKTQTRRSVASLRRAVTLPKHATDYLSTANRWVLELGLPYTEESIRTACKHFGMHRHHASITIDAYRLLGRSVSSEGWDCSTYDDNEIVDRRELVAKMLKKLSPLQRKIFKLRYYQDLPFSEIGEKLGYSRAYCHITHERGIKLLQESFHEYAEDAA